MSHLLALIEKQADEVSPLFVCTEKKSQIFPDTSNYSAQNQQYSIIFDGKLFNKQSLLEKTNLNSKVIDTNNDAEVVLALFANCGTNIFADLEGYWALIIFDSEKRQLIAARDHFGNRPLFYSNTNGYMGISSLMNLLYNLDEKTMEINKNAVVEYLLWGDAIKHNQAFFANVHALPPAYFLLYSFENQGLTVNPYYELPYKRCKAGYNEYEEPFYVDNVRQLVLDSVRNNIENQDSLAFGISGGLDSSAILCSALKLNPDCRYVAFSFVNEHDTRENVWMEKIIQHTAVDWVKVPCQAQEIVKMLPQLIKTQGIPIFNTADFAQYKVMQTAKEHGFDTIVDGQGGDELFGGYTAFFPPFWHSLLSQWMVKDWLIECLHLKNADISYKNACLFALKDFSKRHYFTKERLAKRTKKQELSFLNRELTTDYFRLSKQTENRKEVLNDYLYESYTIFLPNIMRWGEFSARSFGLDCLMPFVNSKKMAEYVFSVPSTYKIHQGWGKYLLRSAMVGIIPDNIRWRQQKIGFEAPEYQWLQKIGTEIKQQIAELNDVDNFIDKNSLLNQWDKLYTPQNFHFQQFVFRYYSYLLWRNEE